jgi:FlaG/FlaF family flagellin (archaellin)
MKLRPDTAVSETISTILMIMLVVILAALILAIVMGIPVLPKKPVLAGFSIEAVKGGDATLPPSLRIPYIRFSQVAGDTLSQEYSTSTHSGINGTKVKLVDPTGKMYTVVQSVTLTGNVIDKGEAFYIFRCRIGEPNEYWLTNDRNRIFASSCVEQFSPHGRWQLLITDEKDTNMVIMDTKVEM